jgi:hypothetical protein
VTTMKSFALFASLALASGLALTGIGALVGVASQTGARSIEHPPASSTRDRRQPTIAPWLQVAPSNASARAPASATTVGVRGTF